ncbi:MAG: T9SS type A sorting domain-containing protein, partial [Parafilimonas sp.]|nr:T9SS type A sorting domain-containing protein [Parafilimonas sp.]
SLFKAVQANDAEPDSSKATAITLPLNSTKTGHEGYYYNNQRDLLDFYKITTDGDGLIQLKLSSGNGNNVQAILYDNDGTTSLGNVVTASTAYLNVDGLSAGTYYVQIGTYYTNQFAPYTITDSLFKPAQANDAEPDSTKATALTLAVNSTTTGHIDYYYKNHRDLIDFYKITTTADGLIQLKLSSGNGYNVQATLYDNDGTTSLGNLVTASTAYLNVDGLSAGTYYVQINSYYSNQFEPYTLTDSLLTYTYTNDKEPNNTAHLAKTLPSNLTTYGHIDFYYNNQRDLIDWHKINYTGTSDLSITYNLQPNISDGGFRNVTFQVYKDTNAAPISNVTFASATTTVNLTGLSEGYYYIKVNPYYTNQFEAYSITPTFTQTDIAKLKVISKGSLANCADTSSIVVKPSGSHAPYTLQLYRFGMPYGDPVFVAGSKNVAFSGLPEGSYMVRAYGDGAAGTAFGKTPNIAFEPVPAGLSTTNIKATSATLNWDTLGCVGYFMIEYKVHGSNTWITKKPQGNVNSYVLKGLTANTTYDWSVAAFDSANKIIATGTYADSVTFTTAASLIAETGNADEDNLSIKNNNSSIAVSVAPNPANSYFIIHYNITSQQKLTATLFDMNGKAVWSSGTINTDALNGKQVMVNQFGSGLYYLKITNNMGAVVGDAKVSITR